ncbi:hypothetical protein SAMN05444159_5752 [Bradyrhizobium lablabi]|uniref:Uncharacterized protein n=1 Tax=Bradyrhizobium lablabi TaxID=722472 RepID=A0A1M7A6G2_9BRAD|nr:hypothetical protein [Bradyrhizobium lablabi]SHL38223.1 hypothetical protein SAMN05444159_5752 [Bradyrhizobium lablabi]
MASSDQNTNFGFGPVIVTPFGLMVVGNGQLNVTLFPDIMLPRRDFFMSSLNGSIGPGTTLSAVLPPDQFNVQTYSNVAPRSVTWTDAQAQGLNYWQTINRNGAAAEAESRSLAVEDRGASSVISSQDYRNPNGSGQFWRQIDSQAVYGSFLRLNGNAIEQIESKAGEPTGQALVRAQAQAVFDTQQVQIPVSMADQMRANGFAIDGVVSQQGDGILIPAARAGDITAAREGGLETRAMGGLLTGAGFGLDAMNFAAAQLADGGTFGSNTEAFLSQAAPAYIGIGGGAIAGAISGGEWAAAARWAGIGGLGGSVLGSALTQAAAFVGDNYQFGPQSQQALTNNAVGWGGAFAGGGLAWSLGSTFGSGFGVGGLVTGGALLNLQMYQSIAATDPQRAVNLQAAAAGDIQAAGGVYDPNGPFYVSPDPVLQPQPFNPGPRPGELAPVVPAFQPDAQYDALGNFLGNYPTPSVDTGANQIPYWSGATVPTNPLTANGITPGFSLINGALLNTQSGQLAFGTPNGPSNTTTNWPGFFSNNTGSTPTIDANALNGLNLTAPLTEFNNATAGMNYIPTDNSVWNNVPTDAPYTYAPGPTVSGEPVVLDLTGNGINITQLGSSGQFHDMTGNGYQNRTAWAGAGNGVLAIDLKGTGKIDSPNEYQFTNWDPTATSDMQALRDVFDTNHDGKLDSGDADWSKFGVLVTNADGTTTFETLTQLGITSINLTTDNNKNVLADGSVISGQSTYTKADGTTGAAADVSLAYDANGYATSQTVTKNADGSTTIDVKATNPDGSLANETVSTTSADGASRTFRRRLPRKNPRRNARLRRGRNRRSPRAHRPAEIISHSTNVLSPRWSNSCCYIGALNRNDGREIAEVQRAVV